MNHLSSGKRRRINRSTSHFSGVTILIVANFIFRAFRSSYAKSVFPPEGRSLSLNKHPNKDLFLFFFSDFKLIYCKRNEFIHINFQFFSRRLSRRTVEWAFPVLLAWIIDLSFVLFYFHCRCERQESLCLCFLFLHSFPRIMTQVLRAFLRSTPLKFIRVYYRLRGRPTARSKSPLKRPSWGSSQIAGEGNWVSALGDVYIN